MMDGIEIAHRIEELTEDYAKELSRLPFQKKVRETLVDGFRDGARSMIRALLDEGVIQ